MTTTAVKPRRATPAPTVSSNAAAAAREAMLARIQGPKAADADGATKEPELNGNGNAIMECGWCNNCVGNLKALRLCGVKGHLICSRDNDLRLAPTHHKIFFGAKLSYFLHAKKTAKDEFGMPQLRELRLALIERRKILQGRLQVVVETQGGIE